MITLPILISGILIMLVFFGLMAFYSRHIKAKEIERLSHFAIWGGRAHCLEGGRWKLYENAVTWNEL